MGKMNFKSPLFAVFIDQFFDNLAYLQDFRNLAIEMRAHLLGFLKKSPIVFCLVMLAFCFTPLDNKLYNIFFRNTLIPPTSRFPNSRFSLTRGFFAAISLQTRGFSCCYFPPNSRFLRICEGPKKREVGGISV